MSAGSAAVVHNVDAFRADAGLLGVDDARDYQAEGQNSTEERHDKGRRAAEDDCATHVHSPSFATGLAVTAASWMWWRFGASAEEVLTTNTLESLETIRVRTIPVAARAALVGRIVQHVADRLPVMGIYNNPTPDALGNRLVNVGAGRAERSERPRVGRQVSIGG